MARSDENGVSSSESGGRYLAVPDDLAAALAEDARAHSNFESMSNSHRTEWVRWIAEAKRDDTRARRIAKAVASLNAGTRHH